MKRFLAVFMSVVVCFSLVFYFSEKVFADYSDITVSMTEDFYNDKYLPDISNLDQRAVDFCNDFYNSDSTNFTNLRTYLHNLTYLDDDFILCSYRFYTNNYSKFCLALTFTNDIDDLKFCYQSTYSYCIKSASSSFYTVSIYYDSFMASETSFLVPDTFKRLSIYSLSNYYHKCFSFEKKLSDLVFTVSPDLCENMDLNEIGGNVTVTVENPSDKAYDYMIWVSKNPSDIGIVNSLYNATYVNSSNQWCYKKQSDASIPPDKVQLVKDKITDEFKTTDILDIVSGVGFVGYNVWGGMYEAAKEYMSYNDDHVTYYSKTQSNCPVYLVNPGGAKQHQIPFCAFNITMNDTYYFNISYKEHSSNVVSSVGASAAALLGAAGGEYDAPIFNTSDFTSYQSYTSIPFSVGSGYTSVNQSDDITGFNVLTYYSNPDNSVANITNDNSVHINDSYNNNYPGGSGSGGSGSGGFVGGASGIVVNGVLVNGTANFSPGLTLQPGIGGGSSGGSSVLTPDLPDAEFQDLYKQSGDFFDFFRDLIESSGFLPVTLFTAACFVALFMRVWGR